jgi:PAS domain-containing protein
MRQKPAAPFADLLPHTGSGLQAVQQVVRQQPSAATPVMNDSLEAWLQATLNVIPAHTWYAAPTGALTFVNERAADYGGLPADHPLRLGITRSFHRIVGETPYAWRRTRRGSLKID